MKGEEVPEELDDDAEESPINPIDELFPELAECFLALATMHQEGGELTEAQRLLNECFRMAVMIFGEKHHNGALLRPWRIVQG